MLWLRQAEPTAQRDAASPTRTAQRVQRRVPQSQQQGDGGIGDFFKGDLPKKLAVMLVWSQRRACCPHQPRSSYSAVSCTRTRAGPPNIVVLSLLLQRVSLCRPRPVCATTLWKCV